MESICK